MEGERLHRDASNSAAPQIDSYVRGTRYLEAGRVVEDCGARHQSILPCIRVICIAGSRSCRSNTSYSCLALRSFERIRTSKPNLIEADAVCKAGRVWIRGFDTIASAAKTCGHSGPHLQSGRRRGRGSRRGAPRQCPLSAHTAAPPPGAPAGGAGAVPPSTCQRVPVRKVCVIKCPPAANVRRSRHRAVRCHVQKQLPARRKPPHEARACAVGCRGAGLMGVSWLNDGRGPPLECEHDGRPALKLRLADPGATGAAGLSAVADQQGFRAASGG